jgi:hypothetical protein
MANSLSRVTTPMPKGPDGQKRPRGTIANAIKVARIATGEERESEGTKKAPLSDKPRKKGR